MGIPNTNTFTLNDIKNEISTEPSGHVVSSLSDAFTGATNSKFDERYVGVKDRQSNFRKYGNIPEIVSVTYSADTCCDVDSTIFLKVVGNEPHTGTTLTLEAIVTGVNVFTDNLFWEDLTEAPLSSSFTNTSNVGGEFRFLDITNLQNGTYTFKCTAQVAGGGTISTEITFLIGLTTSIQSTTKIKIYCDNSGSMPSALQSLQEMAFDNSGDDTKSLKALLLPIYNNDSALYDDNVEVIFTPNNPSTNFYERPLSWLNMTGDTPSGNVVVMVFSDESTPYGIDNSVSESAGYLCPRNSNIDSDLTTLINRLNNFSGDYYRGILFHVESDFGSDYKNFLKALELGETNFTGNPSCYSGPNDGLSLRFEIGYEYNISNSGSPSYYLSKIKSALYELNLL